jgi:hypothetical protein
MARALCLCSRACNGSFPQVQQKTCRVVRPALWSIVSTSLAALPMLTCSCCAARRPAPACTLTFAVACLRARRRTGQRSRRVRVSRGVPCGGGAPTGLPPPPGRLPGIIRRMGLRQPQTPATSLRSQGMRGTVLGLQPKAACAPCARCRAFVYSPPPTPALSPCSPPAQSVGRGAARGARAPIRPQGRPRKKPQPARRNESLAAGWAPSVQASLAALGAIAAWTAPTLLLLQSPPPGRKNGWGKKTKPAYRRAGVGGRARWRDGIPPVDHAAGRPLP